MAKYKPKSYKYELEVLNKLYEKFKNAKTKYEKDRLGVIIKVQESYL